MKVVLAVPYRATPSRAVVWDQLLPLYEALPYRLSVSDSDQSRPFNVSEARNRAVEALDEDWDVVVHVDADTWIDPEALEHLIEVATLRGHALIPEKAIYMNPDQRTVGEEFWHTAGGVVVFPRRVWEAVGGGYDERFRGWGFEDRAMGLAVTALTGDVLYVAGVRIACFYHEQEQGGAWARQRWADGAMPKLAFDYDLAGRDPVEMGRIVGQARAYREWWRGRGTLGT